MRHRSRGQGVSEYLVVLIALVVAALGATAVFGPVLAAKVGTFTLDGGGTNPGPGPNPAPQLPYMSDLGTAGAPKGTALAVSGTTVAGRLEYAASSVAAAWGLADVAAGPAMLTPNDGATIASAYSTDGRWVGGNTGPSAWLYDQQANTTTTIGSPEGLAFTRTMVRSIVQQGGGQPLVAAGTIGSPGSRCYVHDGSAWRRLGVDAPSCQVAGADASTLVATMNTTGANRVYTVDIATGAETALPMPAAASSVTAGGMSGTKVAAYALGANWPDGGGVHALVYDLAAGTYTDLGRIGASGSTVAGISGSLVVGTAYDGTTYHAFVDDITNPGAIWLGEFAGDTDSGATAIDGRIVVGHSGTRSGATWTTQRPMAWNLDAPH